MEKVEFTYKLNDNFLEITPAHIFDNSSYEIRLKNIKSISGKKLSKATVKVTTSLSPSYCSLEAIKSLVEIFEIPEERILYLIREASKHADFIMGGSALDESGKIPFAVEQFVKVKTSLDALTRAYMNKAVSSGERGKVDEVEFENKSSFPSLRDLLGKLRDELLYWQDAMRGYFNEGRTKPSATRLGLKAEYNVLIPHTTAETILNDYTRTLQRS